MWARGCAPSAVLDWLWYAYTPCMFSCLMGYMVCKRADSSKEPLILWRVKHPHIVALLDSYISYPTTIVVMEMYPATLRVRVGKLQWPINPTLFRWSLLCHWFTFWQNLYTLPCLFIWSLPTWGREKEREKETERDHCKQDHLPFQAIFISLKWSNKEGTSKVVAPGYLYTCVYTCSFKVFEVIEVYV